MNTPTKDINLALLIDVDNIAYRYTENILSELSKYGKVTIRRMYGDWSQLRLKSWLSIASKYSLTPIMQPNNSPGKNASDIGLIIDAMDILYSGEVEGFCIVSSDGDFNKLATRIREAGKVVIGMGEKKTPESFRASCERFVFLDVLESALDEDNEDGRDTDFSFPIVKNDALSPSNPLSKPSPLSSNTEALNGAEITPRSALENVIINMISDNTAEGRDTNLSEIGTRLAKIYPDFDIRNYNYSKLSSFIKDFDSLSVTSRNKAVWVSLKGTSLKDMEAQITAIFKQNKTKKMNIGQLKNELQKTNPNLTATVKQNGFTKFSIFLEKKIPCIHVVNNTEAVLTPIKSPSVSQ